jgi:zinc/manganese transport system permease protein
MSVSRTKKIGPLEVFLMVPGINRLAAVILMVMAIYRPQLLSSLDSTLAQVQEINVRQIGLLHLLLLSIAVRLSAMTIRASLSTALLIGPAAAALLVVKRPRLAICVAALIGLGASWGAFCITFQHGLDRYFDGALYNLSGS